MHRRDGKRVTLKDSTRRQLAIRIQPEWARFGVDGHCMSIIEKEEWLARLKECRQLFEELEGANICYQKDILQRANTLFKEIGCDSDDVSRKMEAFLCITSSGLLFICVDKVLRAIEDWDLDESHGIVMGCASDFLKKKEYFEGARGVTQANEQRCRAFIDHKMAEDQRFDVGYHTSEVNGEELLEKWEAFLNVNCDPTKYFSEYYVSHAILKFANPLVEELSKQDTNVSCRLEELLGAFKDMLSEYDPDIEASDGDDDSEMNHSD